MCVLSCMSQHARWRVCVRQFVRVCVHSYERCFFSVCVLVYMCRLGACVRAFLCVTTENECWIVCVY